MMVESCDGLIENVSIRLADVLAVRAASGRLETVSHMAAYLPASAVVFLMPDDSRQGAGDKLSLSTTAGRQALSKTDFVEICALLNNTRSRKGASLLHAILPIEFLATNQHTGNNRSHRLIKHAFHFFDSTAAYTQYYSLTTAANKGGRLAARLQWQEQHAANGKSLAGFYLDGLSGATMDDSEALEILFEQQKLKTKTPEGSSTNTLASLSQPKESESADDDNDNNNNNNNTNNNDTNNKANTNTLSNEGDWNVVDENRRSGCDGSSTVLSIASCPSDGSNLLGYVLQLLALDVDMIEIDFPSVLAAACKLMLIKIIPTAVEVAQYFQLEPYTEVRQTAVCTTLQREVDIWLQVKGKDNLFTTDEEANKAPTNEAPTRKTPANRAPAQESYKSSEEPVDPLRPSIEVEEQAPRENRGSLRRLRNIPMRILSLADEELSNNMESATCLHGILAHVVGTTQQTITNDYSFAALHYMTKCNEPNVLHVAEWHNWTLLGVFFKVAERVKRRTGKKKFIEYLAWVGLVNDTESLAAC